MLFLLLLSGNSVFSQSKSTEGIMDLPYRQIPAEPDTFTAATVIVRLLDGLGFRYYWATEGLRAQDLSYKPSEDGRTSDETINHIYELSRIVFNSIHGEVNSTDTLYRTSSFSDRRKATLLFLKDSSDKLRRNPTLDLSTLKLQFQGKSAISEFPFWNQINGPISDCLWHVGQLITFRRASGNPYNSKASVFTGKVRE